MIDTIVLAWGSGHVPNHQKARSVFDRRSLPLYVDFPELAGRLGSAQGQVRSIRYGNDDQLYGHWKFGAVELLYSPQRARLELRGSLPKILTGRNDALLDEHGVHEALRAMVRVGEELVQRPLELRDAHPTRADYVIQWQDVPVTHALEHLKSYFRPGRITVGKLRTENLSPLFNGHSIVWGYGSKRVFRWYDKGAESAERAYRSGEVELLGLDRELLERASAKERERQLRRARAAAREEARRHRVALGYPLDSILRYEIQERRADRLRTLHHFGYNAHSVLNELQRTVSTLGRLTYVDLDALLAAEARRAIPGLLGCLWLVENDHAWPIVRPHLSRSTYYRMRKKSAAIALRVADWVPEIPDDAFAGASSLWSADATAA